MKQALVAPLLALLILLLSACQPVQRVILPVHTPAALSTGTIPTTILPTTTLLSTRHSSTPDNIPTPGPTLSPKGPYLVVDTNPGAGPLLLLDADSGYKILTLPRNGFIQPLQKAISPDGKWLAFQSDAPGIADSSLTLSLLPLTGSSTRTITRLISRDEPLEQDIGEGKPEENRRINEKMDLYHSAGAAAWSPDGQLLAFSAQIDGSSTDVYLYRLDTGQVHRLVDDPLNVVWIEWSPQGDYILYANASAGLEDREEMLYAVPVNGETMKNPPEIERGAAWIGKGWLSPIHYMTSHKSHDGSFADLRVYNLETGVQSKLWPRPYYDFTFDIQQAKILVSGALNPDRDPRIGLYTVNPAGQMNEFANLGFYGLQYLGKPGARFLGFRLDGLAAIADDGSYRYISHRDSGWIDVSPDHQWFIAYDETGADLFTASGEFVRTLTSSSVQESLWRPDSSSLYLSSEDVLSYFPIPSGEPAAVTCPLANCTLQLANSTWIP